MGPALLAVVLATAPIKTAVIGPGCLDRGSTSINLVTLLFDYFDKRPGEVELRSSGFSVLNDGQRWIFPREAFADGTLVSEALAGMKGQTPEVLAEGVPILVSPWEVSLQWPYSGHFDWLRVLQEQAAATSTFPDATQRMGRVLRYPHAPEVLVFELEGAEGELEPDVTRWRREFSALSVIKTPDHEASLYNFGRQLARGGRVKAELEAAAGDLRLHTGSMVEAEMTPEARSRCTELIGGLGLDAVVPSADDLGLGPEALQAFAKKSGAPYVATNLFAGEKRPFPRFVLKEVRGKTVAIIGVVGRERLARLSAAQRGQWRVEAAGNELRAVVKALQAQLGRRPDLTIVLSSATDADAKAVRRATHVDLVVPEPGRWDMVERRVSVDASGARRHRRPRPSMILRRTPFSLDVVEAVMDPHLQRLEHRSRPILEEGPVDWGVEGSLRALEEKSVPRDSELLMPDPAPIVVKHKELHPLVWGQHILSGAGYRDYPEGPARFTDPLWMRFVGNVLREASGAEVVVLRNMPRNFDMIGPLTRLFIADWLAQDDDLRRYTLPGSALITLAERIQRQGTRGQVPPLEHVFAAGLDAPRRAVAGRPIDPKAPYEVLVGASVAAQPKLAALFAGPGEPQGSLVEQFSARLETWLDPATRRYGEQAPAELEGLLLDQGLRLEPQWTLRVDALSATGAAYRNSENVADFAATREQRVTTPENYSLGGKLNLALIYDGPGLAWETRVRGELARLVLDIEGVPPQEQQDDLLAFTELRFNAVGLELGEARVPLVPYLRSALDTQFTATPNPTEEDPDNTFDHQLLLQQSLGLVARPGAALRELRLGAIYQTDLTGGDVHHDYGLTSGLVLAWPIWGPLLLAGEVDLRYLVPDEDDRIDDLALLLTSKGRLAVALGANFSVFGFVDAYLLRGKVSENDSVGGSWILGGGLEFARIFKL